MEMLMKHAVRIKANPTNSASESLLPSWVDGKQHKHRTVHNILTPILQTLENIESQNCAISPPWQSHRPEVDTSLADELTLIQDTNVKKITTQLFIHSMGDHRAIYTDASVSDGRAAYAVHTDQVDSVERLPDGTSILNAELKAIEAALTSMYKSSPVRTVLYSDNKQAQEKIQSSIGHSSDKTVNIIIKDYSSHPEWHNCLKFAWLPAHVGIIGNEVADQLAKSGLHLPNTYPPVLEKLSTDDAYQAIVELIDREWQNIYDNINSGQHYKSLESVVTRQSKYNGPNRKTERILSRLRLGHILVNSTLQSTNTRQLQPLWRSRRLGPLFNMPSIRHTAVYR
jgi:ribonuclease HI